MKERSLLTEERTRELETLKSAVARRQLGTALSLFIDDCDPVSVHSLACSGGEIADALAKRAGKTAFAEHALRCNLQLTLKQLAEIKNKHWNAFKHFDLREGKPRDDLELMNGFADDQNDHVLFIGWHDLMRATDAMPIEAQVFQAWYFSMYPEKLASDFPIENLNRFFPSLKTMSRKAQKGKLKRVIQITRDTNRVVMADAMTERRPLIVRSPQSIKLP